MVIKCGEHEPRESEKIGIDALAHFLEVKKKRGEVAIFPERSDPPDFWMTVAGDRYAVEVTSIRNEDKQGPHRDALIKEIQKACREEGCPHGAYKLVVKGAPKIPREKTKKGRKAVSRAVGEVKKLGKRSITAPVFEDDNGQLFIEKSLEGSSTVHLLPMSEGWWGREYNPVLLDLFQTAINKKIDRLEKKGVPERCGRSILVFCDAFPYCDTNDAIEMFPQTSRFEYFHSIFWVASFPYRNNTLYPEAPGREGCFLHSKNPHWL